MSKLIKEGIDEDEDETEEREFRVTGNILEMIIKYCGHYQQEEKMKMKKIETPLIGDTLETILDSAWYADFCTKLEFEDFFKMQAAANYMNIKPLWIMICIALDNLHLKGKSPAELRKIFKFAEPEPVAIA